MSEIEARSDVETDPSGSRWGVACVLKSMVRLAVIMIAGAMIVSEVWAHVDVPLSNAVFALFGFGHLLVTSFLWHLGLLAFAAVLLACVLRLRNTALVGVVCVCWSLAPWAGSFFGSSPSGSGDDTLTVYSANLLYSRADFDDVFAQIEALEPDVIVLQEVMWSRVAELRDALEPRYPHVFVSLDTQHPRSAKGSATFSALPFVDEPERYRPEDTPAGFASWPLLRTCVDWDGTEVDVWNVHPAAPTGLRLVDLQDSASRSLAERVEGVELTMPIIIAGDFNAPPRSKTLRRFHAIGFREAHDVTGSGLGATWPLRGIQSKVPGVRIDHVMYRGVRCVESGVAGDIGSDHAPVWAVLTR